LHLLSAETEAALRATGGDERQTARIICDTIATMTDRFAVRTYRRLIDPEFGSIVDLV
jgi:dGTPase